MKATKNIMENIKNNSIISIILLCMGIAVLLLSMHMFRNLYHTQESTEGMAKFRKMKAYIVQDSTDESKLEKIFSDQRSAIRKTEVFFRSLRAKGIPFFTQHGYAMYISKSGNTVRQESVTDIFFDLFGITTVEGRLFTQKEYDEASEVVPIVIGYNLNNEYQVGKVYEFENGGTGETFKGEVIGRLQKNSTYMEFGNISQMTHSLDDSYIIPLGLKDYQNENMDLADCDMKLL